MRFYKQAFESDGSSVHDDYSGAEGEFIRFLSNVLIYKSINGAEKKEFLKMYLWITYVKTQNRRVVDQRKTLYTPESWKSII